MDSRKLPVILANNQPRSEIVRILTQEYICRRKGCPVYLQKVDDWWAEWRVEYATSGKYFRTLEEAELYLQERKFYRVKSK